MITLRPGSRDMHVVYLQRLLNQYFSRDPGVEFLEEDCSFGPRTEAALRRFQGQYEGVGGRLAVNGIAGPEVWRGLGMHTEINHPLPRVGQNSAMSCWVVSGGLASGRMTSALPGLAQFTPVTLPGGGGLEPSLANLDRYAISLRMRLFPMIPTETAELAPLIERGPAILIGRWLSGGLHAVVISAYFGGDSAYSQMIRINNPAPLGRGSIELTDYPQMRLQGTMFDPYALIVK